MEAQIIASPPAVKALNGSSILLGVIACLILGVGVIALPLTWSMPWVGILFDRPTQRVIDVAPDSINHGRVAVGDLILEINGTALREATPTHQERAVGDTVTYTVRRGVDVIFIDVLLEAPSTQERTSRLIHLLLGFSFWFLGMTVFLKEPKHTSRQIFLLTCLTGMAALTLLDLSNVQTRWASYINQPSILLSGAAFVHLHSLFPKRYSSRWMWLVGLFYVGAVLLILVYFRFGLYSPPPLVGEAITTYLILSYTSGSALLFNAWRTGDGSTRRRIRLIVTGTLLAVSPLIVVLLSGEISPDRMAPYSIGIASLIFIPLAYAYALQREDLLTTDLRLYRVLVYLLLTLTLIVGYLLLVQLAAWVRPGSHQTPLVGAIASVIIAFGFTPTRRGIEQLLNRLFYGVEYNYLQVLTPAISRLSALDRKALIEVLTEALPSALRVEQAALWLIDQDTHQVEWAGGHPRLKDVNVSLLIQDPEWIQQLRGDQPIPIPQGFFPSHHHGSVILVRWIVPLVLTDELQGLWLIGPRYRDESFSPVDQRLMAVTAQSSALVVKVMTLLETLQLQLRQSQAHRAELEAAYHQLTQIREDERQHLARELHDEELQSLVALGMQLSQMSEGASPSLAPLFAELQEQVNSMIMSVRRVCQRLRPPALDKGGLDNGLRTLAAEIMQKYGFMIHLNVSLPTRLAPDLESTLYRIVQEALTNVGKHAQAQQADVTLHVSNEGHILELKIQDNGRGFDVHEVRGHRFGLLGLRERAIGVGGRLTVISQPGIGTQIMARIPMKDAAT
jgi:signal transduction histidine kinase